MIIKNSFTLLLSVIACLVAFNSQSQIVISVGNPVSATEGSSNITFDVFIEGGGLNTTGSPITGSIGYAGTGNPGSDFVPETSFSIPVGANSTTVTVTVLDDFLTEPTETVMITLTGSPSFGTYNTTTTTAFIYDDDAASMTLSIGSPTNGLEGVSDVEFIVSIEGGGVNNTGSPIVGSVSYTGTAADAADYVGQSTFSIPNGASSTTLTLSVIDDGLLECDETVVATISNPSIGVINPSGSTSSAIITDDECSQVGISIGSPVDGAEGGNNISFTISLDNGAVNSTGSPITGSISYSGTATSSADYSPVNSFQIPNGAASTVITLPVVDDITIECDETVIATVSNPSIGVINPNAASSTAIIVDNECVQQFGISIGSPVDGTEGVSDVSFVISLDNGAVNTSGSAITGDITFSGTATAADFSASLPMSFSIPDGANSTTLVLSVVDDGCIEMTESVIATISNPSTGTIGNATSTASIFDNSANSLTISIGSPVDGMEGGPNDVSFVISLDNGLINCTGAPITGTISFGGTATVGADYSNANTFAIPDGASQVMHVLAVLDDPFDECDETVIATISNPNVGSINATAGSSTAIIEDDDCTVGLAELSEVGLQLYPNPVSNQLSLKAEERMSAYAVFDLNGRQLISGEINAKEFQLATDFLATGSYLIQIDFEDGSSVKQKITKN